MMTRPKPFRSVRLTAVLALSATTLLGGCFSLGSEAPPQLLTLTAERSAEIGRALSGTADNAIVVEEPASAQVLNTVRVPVQIDQSAVAYVEDAVWAERPSRLFRALLAETIAAGTDRLVVAETELGSAGGTIVSGKLNRFGYDKARQAVVVQYDAVVRGAGMSLRQRRFEASEPVYEVEAREVGAALNRAANRVAAEAADWIVQ